MRIWNERAIIHVTFGCLALWEMKTQLKFKCRLNSNMDLDSLVFVYHVHVVVRNEIQMRIYFKRAWVWFLSATFEWMIVLQSFKFENFITFLFLFALLIRGKFGEFVLLLMNMKYGLKILISYYHILLNLWDTINFIKYFTIMFSYKC